MSYHWEICSTCSGEGSRVLHGADFTMSEWHEMCRDDPDFEEDYFGGVYDTVCPECMGTGKVKVYSGESLYMEP